MSFDGHILRRGFWLYVWRIKSGRGTILYVGRTGDSSSDFTSSPFVRIGRHLDLRPNAKSNSFARRLRENGLKPVECSFEFLALGPLFPEQQTTEHHRNFRDRIGALEALLANKLRDRGYEVIGIHALRGKPTAADAAQLQKLINKFRVHRRLRATSLGHQTAGRNSQSPMRNKCSRWR